MVCSNCGHTVSDSARFCKFCGSRLDGQKDDLIEEDGNGTETNTDSLPAAEENTPAGAEEGLSENPEREDSENQSDGESDGALTNPTPPEGYGGVEQNPGAGDAFEPIVSDSSLLPVQEGVSEAGTAGSDAERRLSPGVKITMVVSGVLFVVFLAALLTTLLFSVKKPLVPTNALTAVTQKQSAQSLTLDRSDLQLSKNETAKLTALTSPAKQAGNLVWKSSSANIQVDQSGMVTALAADTSGTVTVSNPNGSLHASCAVKVVSDQEAFLQTVALLNGEQQFQTEKIDPYAENYQVGTRKGNLAWDDTLFYSLEDVDPAKTSDGKIDFYTIEKKQMVNAESGNPIEYEIYSSPDTHEVNKIVSIETVGDKVEITDYYYDKGKVNFIFQRTDEVYTPTYASPDKVGQRFYFNNDLLVKWRVIDQPMQIKDYTHGSTETGTPYEKLPADLQQAYDRNEKRMLNAAYNTYHQVLLAHSFGTISGAVMDENGAPMQGAAVKVFSTTYSVAVGETQTDSNGQYSIRVPSMGSYTVRISKDGYTDSEIYRIDMGLQTLSAYQENVYLIPENSGTHSIHVLLTDALNTAGGSVQDDPYAQYNNPMQRLTGALLKVRQGVNNRTGDVVATGTADGYGSVNLQLPGGMYTGEVDLTGYATSYFTIVSRKDDDYVQSATSPILSDNELRIVLTWGETPSDLDSHLFTPYQGTNGDMQHIGYYEKSDPYGNNLDVDDTTSYGPETVTIKNLGSGTYKYFVADYTDCGRDPNSMNMSNSNACVSVYTKDGLVQTFHVPRNRAGVIWEVFSIRNKQIVPTQRYYNNINDKPWWKSSKTGGSYTSSNVNYN